MATTPKVQTFWQNFLNGLPADARLKSMPDAWGFGDSAEMADSLGCLVQAGTKTATCSLRWVYDQELEPMPKVGDLNIILDGNELPLCIIEITEITHKPYNEVDAQFAHDEGEGDRSLNYWREAHWNFFTRQCADLNREVSEDMPLVCERFRVVYKNLQ